MGGSTQQQTLMPTFNADFLTTLTHQSIRKPMPSMDACLSQMATLMITVITW